MNTNEEIIYLIQQVEDIRLKPERKREIIDREERRYLTARYYFNKSKSSLELMDRFKKFLKKYNLEILELNGVKDKNKGLIDFILKERIKKKLSYKFVVNLNDEYQLYFFPECPRELIYKNFIILTTTLNDIENDMINYLTFMKKSEFQRNLELYPNIHAYIKINPKYDFIKKLVDHLSFSEEKKVYRIKLESELGEEEQDFKLSILIGEEDNYLSSRGLANDLNYILFIKEYYKKVV